MGGECDIRCWDRDASVGLFGEARHRVAGRAAAIGGADVRIVLGCPHLRTLVTRTAPGNEAFVRGNATFVGVGDRSDGIGVQGD